MSTNTTRSAKLYSGLTPAQLARIAHGYIAKRDEAELQRIMEAVPVYSYRGVSRDYLREVSIPHDIAMLASVCYWQETAKLAAKCGLFLVAENNAPAKLEAASGIVIGAQARRNALIAAWQELCEHMGWDMAALSETAGIPIHPPPAEYDEATKAEHLEGWQSILDSAGVVAA
jgi:hypothetical protein